MYRVNKNETLTKPAIEIHDNFSDLIGLLTEKRNNEVLKTFEYVIIREPKSLDNPTFAKLIGKTIELVYMCLSNI